MTSEFLFVSFDCISSPNVSLRPQADKVSSGWGFGWYPNDGYAASVVKDTGIKKAEDITRSLSGWHHFRSSMFLYKVQGAAKNPMQQDTQPFQRALGGSDWLFMHNGDLDKTQLAKFTGHPKPIFEPLGRTDTEIAFCYLLQKFYDAGYKRIAEIDPALLQEELTRLGTAGSADFVMADGQSALVYHGINSSRNLYYAKLKPPYPPEFALYDDNVVFDFSDPQDAYRTAFVVSSIKLDGCNWQTFQPDEMVIIRRSSRLKPFRHTQIMAQRFVAPMYPQFLSGTIVPFTSTENVRQLSAPVVTNIKSILSNKDGTPLQYRSYNIKHVTEYEYTSPVESSSHILRLQPVEDKTQEVIRSTLLFSVDAEHNYYEDVFGNHAIGVIVDQPYERLRIETESLIKVYASPKDNLLSIARRTTNPLVWMPWQRQMMLPYLLPPELPETQLMELYEYAMSFVKRVDSHLMDTLSEMNRQIFNDYMYVQGQTTVTTTPFEIYTSRRGVCQDFANLFICLARLLNIPARYRVGYIYTGRDHHNQAQSDASHAWAEVYLPYCGWKGYDPTNGTEVSQEHTRVACGRNFVDAAPVSGTLFKGGRNEKLTVSVQVEER